MEGGTSSAPCGWHLPAVIGTEAGGEVAPRGRGADVRRSGNVVLVIFRWGSPARSNAAATAESSSASCVAYLRPGAFLGALAQCVAMLQASNGSRSDLLCHGSLGEVGEETNEGSLFFFLFFSCCH